MIRDRRIYKRKRRKKMEEEEGMKKKQDLIRKYGKLFYVAPKIDRIS
jgi:hypothetical protein